MGNRFMESLEDQPVIAAVKNNLELKLAIDSPCQIIFTLFGEVCTIADEVSQIKSAGKLAIVHLDLVEGLESKPVSVAFMRTHTNADGIISTKPQIIKAAREAGFITVQRFFVLDSRSYDSIYKHVSYADAVEILPGVMPKIISRLTGEIRVPLIAGGLISDKEDVISALGAGASAVSTTRSELWDI